MLKCYCLISALIVIPQLVMASNWHEFWQNLWFNNNQQGMHLLQHHDNQAAAAKFSDPQWQGIADYNNKQYNQAYTLFKQDNSPRELYNQGNALAQLHKYNDALTTYKKVLQQDPNYPDVKHNIAIVEKLLQNQQNQQNQHSKSEPAKSDSTVKSDSKPSTTKPQQPAANNTNIQQVQPGAPDANDRHGSTQYISPQQQKIDHDVNKALAQIPDDTGGLLRNKFLRDYQKQQGN